MGHERVGFLPRTKHWRRLVEQISEAADASAIAPVLASNTIRNVRQRFDSIHSDTGFQAAFSFLLALATSHLSSIQPGPAYPDIDFSDNPSPFRLTARMRSWVDQKRNSLEYAELAKRAAADAIVFWIDRNSRQSQLFLAEPTASQLWSRSSNGAAFSELTRVFLAKFTERYIKYFLDREASAQIQNVYARERFASSVARHVDLLTLHAFESSKITESFAAGWYNKHARQSRPDSKAIRSFLSFAMGKLRQELQREASTA